MPESGNKPIFDHSYSFTANGTAEAGAALTGAAGGAAAAQRPAVAVDQEWRRWVAENVLLRNEPPSIVEAMVNAGIDRATATREVQAALDHPYIRAARQIHASAADADRNLDAKVQKRDWVLECYRRTARQATTHGQVPRMPKLSRQTFLDEFYALNRPVVMTCAMDDWPAMTRWTAKELKRRFGDRVVSVQANRDSDANYELNSARLRSEMTFGEFVDITETIGETNNYYITANNSETNTAALKDLWNDIVPFPEYLRDDPANRGFFWFGPKGTVTPLHHDLTNNFMAQVRGRKLVRLIAPCELPNLYNNRHCYSAVNLDRIDYDRFPLFSNVTVLDVEIGPGDLLFLPVGWWHYVRGLEVSITMTFTNFVFDNDFYSMYKTYQEI
ncbi:MAG: cupin-like domain-containing protein [Casimicrobiaceae bacterium]